MRGYIKLYRQIAENAIWLIKPFSEGQAWVDLLCISTFDKGFIKTKNGQIIELTAGDCGYSQLSLSERWGWSRGKVKRFILLLEKQKMIQQKMYGKFSVINILNYEKYQNRTTNDTTNSTINDTLTEQQMIQQTDTINNDNNDNNDKNVISINADKTKKIDTYINPIVNKFKETHKKIIGSRVYLNNAECNKLIELAAVVEDFSSTMPTVFKKLKKLKFDGIGYKPNASWLLKDNHYTEILNGAYDVENSYKTASQRKADAIDRLGG